MPFLRLIKERLFGSAAYEGAPQQNTVRTVRFASVIALLLVGSLGCSGQVANPPDDRAPVGDVRKADTPMPRPDRSDPGPDFIDGSPPDRSSQDGSSDGPSPDAPLGPPLVR